MQCPLCNVDLTRTFVHNVPVDECPQCRGLWFEHGEWEQARDTAAPDLRWLDIDLWKELSDLTTRPSPRHCPQCSAPMLIVAHPHAGVELDLCPHKHGVWFDAGEFQRMLEAMHAELYAKDTGELFQEALRQGMDIITRRGSLSAEWHDLTTVLRLVQYRLLVTNPRLDDWFTGYLKTHTPEK